MEQEQSVAGRSADELPEWQSARRQRIVDAALAALETQEYDDIRVGEVARAANVAQGTLYRYFSSKEHLYAAVLLDWMERQRGMRARPRPRTADKRARLRVRAAIGAFERQPQFFRVLNVLQNSTDPHARRLLREVAATAQGMLAHDFAPLGPAAEDVAAMAWAIIISLMTSAHSHQRSMRDVDRVADRFIDLVADRLNQ